MNRELIVKCLILVRKKHPIIKEGQKLVNIPKEERLWGLRGRVFRVQLNKTKRLRVKIEKVVMVTQVPTK